MPVSWLRQALRHLEQAHRSISVQDPGVAVQMVLRVQAAANQLETFPLMGKVGRVEGTKELVIPGMSVIVIYRLQEKTVQILRILPPSKRYSG